MSLHPASVSETLIHPPGLLSNYFVTFHCPPPLVADLLNSYILGTADDMHGNQCPKPSQSVTTTTVRILIQCFMLPEQFIYPPCSGQVERVGPNPRLRIESPPWSLKSTSLFRKILSWNHAWRSPALFINRHTAPTATAMFMPRARRALRFPYRTGGQSHRHLCCKRVRSFLVLGARSNILAQLKV